MITPTPPIAAYVCASIARSIFSFITPADVMRIESNLSTFKAQFGEAQDDRDWVCQNDTSFGPARIKGQLDR